MIISGWKTISVAIIFDTFHCCWNYWMGFLLNKPFFIAILCSLPHIVLVVAAIFWSLTLFYWKAIYLQEGYISRKINRKYSYTRFMKNKKMANFPKVLCEFQTLFAQNYDYASYALLLKESSYIYSFPWNVTKNFWA